MFHTMYIITSMFILPVIFYLVDKRKNNVVGVDACKWFIFWAIGFRAFTTGAMQFLNPSYTMGLLQLSEESRIIIMELGFAQFAIGIIGLLSIRIKSFRVPSIITYGIFMLGASFIHIIRFNTANVEEIVSLASDLFVIIVGIIYAIQYFGLKYKRKKQTKFSHN